MNTRGSWKPRMMTALKGLQGLGFKCEHSWSSSLQLEDVEWGWAAWKPRNNAGIGLSNHDTHFHGELVWVGRIMQEVCIDSAWFGCFERHACHDPFQV